jgi:hypothetical protein
MASGKQQEQRRRFKEAAKSCRGRSKGAFRTCMREKLGGSGKRRRRRRK